MVVPKGKKVKDNPSDKGISINLLHQWYPLQITNEIHKKPEITPRIYLNESKFGQDKTCYQIC